MDVKGGGQGEGSSYLDVLIENFTGRGWGKKLGWTLSFIIFLYGFSFQSKYILKLGKTPYSVCD